MPKQSLCDKCTNNVCKCRSCKGITSNIVNSECLTFDCVFNTTDDTCYSFTDKEVK